MEAKSRTKYYLKSVNLKNIQNVSLPLTLKTRVTYHPICYVLVSTYIHNKFSSQYFQRIEPQQSPTKYIEKAVGSPNSLTVKPIEAPVSRPTENSRVSSIVNAINQGQNNGGSNLNSSIRGRISKSSSKDDLIKDQSTESLLQEALNSSSNSVSI